MVTWPEEDALRPGERDFTVDHGHMFHPRAIEWLGLADSGALVRSSE